MIFESVINVTSKDEFLEKILIYIRLVEVFAERNGFVIESLDNACPAIISEMINIGVIEKNSEIEDLKKFEEACGGKLDYTIGSALDLFGGSISYREIVKSSIQNCTKQ